MCGAAGEFARVKTTESFTIAAVASRKVLCVNDRVQALKAAWRINDQCLELQSKSDSKKQMLAGVLQSHSIFERKSSALSPAHPRVPEICRSNTTNSLAECLRMIK